MLTTTETFDRISSAIICPPGKNIAAAATIGVPDGLRAAIQHQKYAEALRQCGVTVTTIAADPVFPNACLIGNTALVMENLAVIGNFKDHSPRQGEQKSIASALAGDKFLKFITSPGLLDFDDVVRVGTQYYISLSPNTNQEGAAQLAFFLREFGYKITVLEQDRENAVRLNTSVTYLGQKILLLREELSRNFAFLGFDKIIVPHSERGAANAVMVNGTLLLPFGYPEISAKVKEFGIPVIEINVSEFEKIGGGLKSLSLRLPQALHTGPVELPRRTYIAA
jgi:dimethylargininase